MSSLTNSAPLRPVQIEFCFGRMNAMPKLQHALALTLAKTPCFVKAIPAIVSVAAAVYVISENIDAHGGSKKS